jgi:hypothetical protein
MRGPRLAVVALDVEKGRPDVTVRSAEAGPSAPLGGGRRCRHPGGMGGGATLVQQAQVRAQLVGEHRRTPAHDDRADEELDLVDEPGPEGIGGDVGAADREVGVGLPYRWARTKASTAPPAPVVAGSVHAAGRQPAAAIASVARRTAVRTSAGWVTSAAARSSKVGFTKATSAAPRGQ